MLRGRLRSGIKRRVKKALGLNGVEQPTASSAPTQSWEPPVVAPEPDPVSVSVPESVDEPVSAAPEPETVPDPEPEETPLDASEPELEDDDDDFEDVPLTLENVQSILDDMVRPALQADGGDISLLKVEDNNVYVKLVGACSSCPSSVLTMKMGVERLLQEEFPQMEKLIEMDGLAVA